MNDLVAKIKILRDSRTDDNNNGYEIYQLVEKQLKHESNDIEMWLSLAIVSSLPPYESEIRSISCLEKVLELDENNVMALLILAYICEYERGGMNDELLHKIESLDAGSNELNSMLKYVASLAYSKYKKNNPLIEEKLLKESIQLGSNYVWNYVRLAELYFKQGRDSETRELAKKAVSNVQKIFSVNEFDATNVDEYISTYIKGIYVTDFQLSIIRQLLGEKKSTKNLIEKLKLLHNSHTSNDIWEICHIVEEQLKHESDDIEMWLRLALIIYSVPIVDQYKAIECLEKVIEIDKSNAIALLILTYVYEHELGGIDDELLYKIEALDARSAELDSMLKYVASWSYAKSKKNDPQIKERLLKESIQLCSNHVWNYVHLAKLYFDQGQDVEAHKLVEKAISNVKYIYPDNAKYDPTDVNEFLNERIKGVHLTDGNLNSIKELFDGKKPK